MKLLKHLSLMAIVTILTIIMAACSQQPGDTSGYNTTSSSTPASTSAPASTAPTSSASSANSLKAATISVKGVSKTVLTDPQGKTLYYFTPDSATKSACLSSCVGTWPPLLDQSFQLPSGFNGTLSVQDGGNGKQAQYNGHFLYTFSGDSAPGDANGQGIGGKWFVITADLK